MSYLKVSALLSIRMWFLVTDPKLNLIALGSGFYPLFSITTITPSSMTAKAALKSKYFAEKKESLKSGLS